MKKTQVSTLALVSCPARKSTPSWSISSSRVKARPPRSSRAAITAAAMSSKLRPSPSRWVSSSSPSWCRISRQASSTPGCCGTRVQAGSMMSRRISTCATLRSKMVKASKTSCATWVCRVVEKTVRQMMSAVRWLIARSSEKGAPVPAASSSVASQASTPACIAGKARFTRIIDSAGSIIARCRFQVAPLLTKMLSPISGSSAFTIRSLFGKIPCGSSSTWRTRSGWLTMMVERRE